MTRIVRHALLNAYQNVIIVQSMFAGNVRFHATMERIMPAKSALKRNELRATNK